MKWLDVDTENCSVRRTLDLIGDRWSLLVLRDAMNGVRRFDAFRRHMGLSEAVLADRLRKLVAAGVLETRPYREPGARTRSEYRLTAKGWDLWPAMIALMQWGDKYTADPEGPVLEVRHTGCDAEVRAVVECPADHAPLTPREVTVRPGPSAHPVRRNAPHSRPDDHASLG
ncbi:winged helix-turn-helix transcriptional regulator [Actinacidiphila alni]|uniref:Transcriptional regulator, HxlR family n=1 Tax=Actinacidiphila alni TaxID=380248 RepID=A0A1I2KM36_9ACTN|nr:helix-turn-helix domain-containing protein [Actinacidiphila alni]SFF66171.1 transcriptional regulator, HxlR family [Actinacidiphila alni]